MANGCRPTYPGCEDCPGTHEVTALWAPSGIWLEAKAPAGSEASDSAALISARHAMQVLQELLGALTEELLQYPGERARLEEPLREFARAVERLRGMAADGE